MVCLSRLSNAQIILLPNTYSLETGKDDPAFEFIALDESGNELGRLTPDLAPRAILLWAFLVLQIFLIALDQQEKVGSVSIRSSGDTTDHVDAVARRKNFL